MPVLDHSLSVQSVGSRTRQMRRAEWGTEISMQPDGSWVIISSHLSSLQWKSQAQKDEVFPDPWAGEGEGLGGKKSDVFWLLELRLDQSRFVSYSLF